MGDHLHEAEALARSLGDQHRLARIATFMAMQRRAAGDFDGALKFGLEALAIARTHGDRSIEVAATWYLGEAHAVRGEWSEAANLLKRNVGLEGKLRTERFGTPLILSVASEWLLAGALSHLGRFDEAIGHFETALRIAEETDRPWTLFLGLLQLGWSHLDRGDFPRAAQVLERSLHLGHTWQFVGRIPDINAALSVAYALAGRTEESLALAAGALKESGALQITRTLPPHYFLSYAGRAYLAAGRIDEAANYAREALAHTRQLGLRAGEAPVLCLTADVAAASDGENAEDHYREALALAEPRGMRPLVAHCHFGLGKLRRRRGDREKARRHLTTAMAMYRQMGMTYWLEPTEAELRQLG
jgi:tetratricopeptide (TPR) repeat protein